MEAAAAAALVDEAAKRSGLLWVRAVGSDGPARPVWHVWQDSSVYVLTGGIEQPMPEGLDAPAARAELTLRSKDKGSRLLVVVATVETLTPGTPEWDAVVPTLQSKRLNSPDGDAAPARWAAECTVFRLTPGTDYVELPDAPSTASHATAPPATPATTPVPRPWHLFGRAARERSRQDHHRP